MAKGSKGQIVQVLGPVVDIEFPSGELPEINYAVEIQRDNSRMICEVQQHLGENVVRTVAMDTTDGLRRGMVALDTGGPIMVPVGPSTLGRIFNVTGDVIDNGAPGKPEKYYPIHRPAPSYEEQVTTPQFFETGMKVMRPELTVLHTASRFWNRSIV